MQIKTAVTGNVISNVDCIIQSLQMQVPERDPAPRCKLARVDRIVNVEFFEILRLADNPAMRNHTT